MSDNDLIRRGDALDCFLGLDPTGDIMDAIAALPAVMEGVALSVPEVGSVRTGGPGMTDEELIARLRELTGTYGIGDLAANRIKALTEQLTATQQDAKEADAYAEELEADRRKTYEALLKVSRIHGEVEAKLAKAVEALEALIQLSHDCEKELTEDLHHMDFCGESEPLTNARATLAEIKGESHE